MLWNIFTFILGLIVVILVAGFGVLLLIAAFIRAIKRLFADDREYRTTVRFTRED